MPSEKKVFLSIHKKSKYYKKFIISQITQICVSITLITKEINSLFPLKDMRIYPA